MREWPGFTLLEALMTVLCVGIISTIAITAYTGAQQEGYRREAAAYLQVLRQAALAHYQQWGAYPTTINNLRPTANAPPIVQVPAQTDRLSRWAYGYGSSDPTQDSTQWVPPRALFRNFNGSLQGSYREMAIDGTITDFTTGADFGWLTDEP